MKLGFIGAGNMAAALLQGIFKGGKHELGAFDIDSVRLQKLERFGVQGFMDAISLINWADIVFLAVKPSVMHTVMREIRGVCSGKPIVSIAAGITRTQIQKALPDARSLRAMPSLPAVVGEGITIISLEHDLLYDEMEVVCSVFDSIGKTFFLPEKDMAAAYSVSSSGPAYFFIIIEALADAAVNLGLQRDTAYALAAQTALGSGLLARDSGQNPAALKDAVCSPNGTTIRAVISLEKNGLRSAMMQAVDVCYARAKELENE